MYAGYDTSYGGALEPVSEREQAIRTAVDEWAQTAGALGQWAMAETDALATLNEPV